jgi:hypothetical protein
LLVYASEHSNAMLNFPNLGRSPNSSESTTPEARTPEIVRPGPPSLQAIKEGLPTTSLDGSYGFASNGSPVESTAL